MDARGGARRKGHDSIVIRWQVGEKDRNSQKAHGRTEEIRQYLDHLTTTDTSNTAPWHQRHRYKNTIMLVCNDDIRQAGPMRARKDSKPTTKFLTRPRQELGRLNSYIPKNERVRQRPFDEALRADLEWQSQNWNTHWLQTSSSSSSQQRWQHKHQDSINGANTKTLNGEITIGGKSDGYRQFQSHIGFVSQISRTDMSECRARDGA